ESLAKLFPMMMTAAGTVFAARVLVMGAGVAGLQAIATARRLGAQVWGYDVRAAVKEQVESLGAKFLEFDLGIADAEDRGGYARALSPEASRRQQELLAERTKEFDVVITTALVPGRPAPRLVTGETVAGMRPGSVIVDLAAEAGGNCELTEPDQVVVRHGVTIHGPTNLPATLPVHASQLYARNVTELLRELVKDGALALDFRIPDRMRRMFRAAEERAGGARRPVELQALGAVLALVGVVAAVLYATKPAGMAIGEYLHEHVAAEALRYCYIVSAGMFVLGLKGLSSPKWARSGMALAALGMLIAVVGTLFHPHIVTYRWIGLGF